MDARNAFVELVPLMGAACALRPTGRATAALTPAIRLLAPRVPDGVRPVQSVGDVSRGSASPLTP
jgi:hypothetical protein